MQPVLRGFTLIEILVTVTILAIVATIASPLIGNGYDGIRVSSAARMVMSDMLYAQNSAITTQNRTFVHFVDDKQATPRKAYSVAYFPGQLASHPLTFDLVKAATNGTVTATDGTSGIIVKQPTTQSRFLVQFGIANENAPGPLSRTVISSIKTGTTSPGSTPITVFGFDSLGQPLKDDGSTCMEHIYITLQNVRGDISQTLDISPITGEISVP